MMSTDQSLLGNFSQPKENAYEAASEDEYRVPDLTPQQIAGYKEAIVELEKAAELIPDEAEVHAFMAMCHWAIDDLDRAIACYTRAIDANPARDDIISGRMAALLEKGRFEEAEKDLKLLESLESEFVAVQRSNLMEKKATQPDN